MIQLNELRIGNYINQIEYKNGFCNAMRIVTAIRQEGYLNVRVIGKHNMGSHIINWFEPIPLNEAWLIKFGFSLKTKNNFNCYQLPNGWHVCMWTLNYCMAGFEENGVCYWGEDYTTIKHVHQLQNLYYCLTGEELKIKS